MSEPDDGGGQEHKEAENPWSAGFDAQDQIHSGLDVFNDANKANGWTAGMAEANNIEHTAQQAYNLESNASAMGNNTSALRFGWRGDALMQEASEAREVGAAGQLNSVLESGAAKALGVAGVGVGAYNTYDDIKKKDYTQAGMDGTAALLGGIALAQPELAPVAAGAALAAAGNKETKDWNNPFTGKALWGNNADGSRRDSVQWVGHNTSDAFNQDLNATTGTFNSVKNWAGGGVMGDVAGGLASAPVALAGAAHTAETAIGSGAVALGTDLVGGAVSVGKGLWGLEGELEKKAPWAMAPLMPFGGPHAMLAAGQEAATNTVNTEKNVYNSVNKFVGGGVTGSIAGGLATAATAAPVAAFNAGKSMLNSGVNTAKSVIGAGTSAVKSVGNFVSHLW